VFCQRKIVRRTGEVDGKDGIVVAYIGPEQQRMHAVDQEFQPREIARVGVKYAVCPIGGRADVAMTIKHGEGVTVFEGNAWPARRARCRDVERGLGYGLGSRRR
jgi:hypothetical protein